MVYIKKLKKVDDEISKNILEKAHRKIERQRNKDAKEREIQRKMDEER